MKKLRLGEISKTPQSHTVSRGQHQSFICSKSFQSLVAIYDFFPSCSLLSCISVVYYQNLANFRSLFFQMFLLKSPPSALFPGLRCHKRETSGIHRQEERLFNACTHLIFFSLLLRLGNFYWFVLKCNDSSGELFIWLLYFSALKFPLDSFYIFISLLRFSVFPFISSLPAFTSWSISVIAT